MCCQAICGPEERNAQRAALSSTLLTLNMWCRARGYSSGLRAERLWVLKHRSQNEPNIGQFLKSKSGFPNTVHEQMPFNTRVEDDLAYFVSKALCDLFRAGFGSKV